MKKIALCLILLLPLVSQADETEEFPSRKAGLWEVTTTMAGMPTNQTIKQCIDASTDKAMMKMGKNMDKKMGADCAKNEFRKEGDNFITEVDCKTGGTRMIAKSVFSGDFTSQYSGETTTKFDPPVMGMTERKMTLSAKWVGPCQAGQKPGDIIMANGMKMNFNDLEKMGAAIPR